MLFAMGCGMEVVFHVTGGGGEGEKRGLGFGLGVQFWKGLGSRQKSAFTLRGWVVGFWVKRSGVIV